MEMNEPVFNMALVGIRLSWANILNGPSEVGQVENVIGDCEYATLNRLQEYLTSRGTTGQEHFAGGHRRQINQWKLGALME